MYGSEKINSIRFLKDNYLSNDSSFTYKDGYDVGNGKHLANEFRFIYARLITEYLDNTPYQDNFREYLVSSNVKTTDDMMTYFKINGLDDLVLNQITKYNLLKNFLKAFCWKSVERISILHRKRSSFWNLCRKS